MTTNITVLSNIHITDSTLHWTPTEYQVTPFTESRWLKIEIQVLIGLSKLLDEDNIQSTSTPTQIITDIKKTSDGLQVKIQMVTNTRRVS